MSLIKDNVKLSINDSGYVEHKSLIAAIEAHDYLLSLPSIREAINATKDFLGNDPPTMMEKESVYVHPQVASYLAGRVHQGKVRTALYCILADHRSRKSTASTGSAPKDAEAVNVRLAEEKTKQIKLQSDVAQKAIGTLSDYSVASRPNLVSVISSIIEQFDPSDISIRTS